MSHESAMGDVAINRALSLGVEMDKSKGVQTAGAHSSALHLNAIETLILSVICSQGLPAFTSHNWEGLVRPDCVIEGDEMPGEEFVINWYRMGGVVLNAASVWADIARTNYEQKQMQLERNGANLSSEELNDLRADCRQLELDLKRKQDASEEASTLRDDPQLLAKKSIMMLAALRTKMGSLDKMNEFGLGSKVLHWCNKELSEWANVLEIIDEQKGEPLPAVSFDYLRDDSEMDVAAVFDKKSCRTVFVQVAQQTRLRSLFVKNGLDKIAHERMPHAVTLSESSGDEWDRPSWWICNADKIGTPMPCPDDMDLLSGILDYGYSGFDEMIRQTETFFLRCQGKERKKQSKSLFTRASVQQRVNHLTRELHELEDSIDVHRLMNDRKGVAPTTKKDSGSVQKGINAFFVAKGGTGIPESPTPSNDDDDDVEVIEIDDEDVESSNGGVKRSRAEGTVFDDVGSAEKKLKADG